MDSSSKVRELELTVQRLWQRVDALEAHAKPSAKGEWLTPAKAAEASGGRYSEYLIRARIDRAIESPVSTRLIAGKHYSKTRIGESRWQYKVYWPAFDDLLQQESTLEN
jgi:hypothetical protein